MRKLLVVVSILATIVLADLKTSFGQNFIKEETWANQVNGQVIFQRERITTNRMGQLEPLPAMKRPHVVPGGQIVKDASGKLYRWFPKQSSSNQKKTGARVRSRPTVVKVIYRLGKGETVANLNRYTKKPASNQILKATGITDAQAKKMPVNFPVAIPEKDLRPEYRNPLKQIDNLTKRLEELEEKLKDYNTTIQDKKRLEGEVVALKKYIADYHKGASEYVDKTDSRLSNLEKILKDNGFATERQQPIIKPVPSSTQQEPAQMVPQQES